MVYVVANCYIFQCGFAWIRCAKALATWAPDFVTQWRWIRRPVESVATTLGMEMGLCWKYGLNRYPLVSITLENHFMGKLTMNGHNSYVNSPESILKVHVFRMINLDKRYCLCVCVCGYIPEKWFVFGAGKKQRAKTAENNSAKMWGDLGASGCRCCHFFGGAVLFQLWHFGVSGRVSLGSWRVWPEAFEGLRKCQEYFGDALIYQWSVQWSLQEDLLKSQAAVGCLFSFNDFIMEHVRKARLIFAHVQRNRQTSVTMQTHSKNPWLFVSAISWGNINAAHLIGGF